MQPPTQTLNVDIADEIYYYDLALNIPYHHTWLYQSKEQFVVGQMVYVQFGKQKKITTACVINCKLANQLDENQKALLVKHSIKNILQALPYKINEKQLALAQFMANYYHEGLGECIYLALPAKLKQVKHAQTQNLQIMLDKSYQAIEKTIQKYHKNILKLQKNANDTSITNQNHQDYENNSTLNQEQTNIYEAVYQQLNRYQVHVIQGVTGSGKTRLYLKWVKKIIEEGKQVLILLPEINLTPQLAQELNNAMPEHTNIALLHSQITDAKRFEIYQQLEKGHIQIIVGTRLAVLSAFNDLGLIVVDEEHDASYKQEDSIRYHARDIAIWRAKQFNCPIILVSATPSLETLMHMQTGQYQSHYLTHKAHANAKNFVELIDMSKYSYVESGLSPYLMQAIEYHTQKQQQVLLFINQRGYAPAYMCLDCKTINQCKYCSSYMVLHQNSRLQCHHCGFSLAKPNVCTACGSHNLKSVGHGTQKLQETLENKGYSIERIDTDTIKNTKIMQEAMARIDAKACQIIIGTQMLAKGHNFKHIGLLGVIQPDGALYAPHIRSQEQLLQQLIQVMGRAGRFMHAKVLIQTYLPQHFIYQASLQQNYTLAAEQLLQDRKNFNFYPYAHAAYLHVGASNANRAQQALQTLLQKLAPLIQSHQLLSSGCLLHPMPRKQNQDRFYCMFEHTNRQNLHQFLKQSLPFIQDALNSNINWYIDINPMHL